MNYIPLEEKRPFSDANIFLLPVVDITYKHILPRITLKETCRLLRVCKSFNQIVGTYFQEYCDTLDVSSGSLRLQSGNIEQIFENSSSIRCLLLANGKSWLRDKLLCHLLRANNSVLKIDVSGCYGLSENAFLTIADTCTKLSVLNLSECRQLSPTALKIIGMKVTTLRRLNVSGCWNLKNECVCTVFENNSSLEDVDISMCYSLTDTVIMSLAMNAPSLKHLNIKSCGRITDQSVRALYEYNKLLKSISAKGCNLVTEMSLARMRPRGISVDVDKPPHRVGELILTKLPFLQI